MKFGYWHQSTKAFTRPYKKDFFFFADKYARYLTGNNMERKIRLKTEPL